MFDRFVLGNSTTLRGWNRYDLAPVGASRMVHNSVEYRYRAFEVFYDAGALWNAGQNVTARHSTGAGLHLGDLALLVAFPLRSGRADPVFIAGLNL
jgi:outer membrane protein assembly factor BamA